MPNETNEENQVLDEEEDLDIPFTEDEDEWEDAYYGNEDGLRWDPWTW